MKENDKIIFHVPLKILVNVSSNDACLFDRIFNTDVASNIARPEIRLSAMKHFIKCCIQYFINYFFLFYRRDIMFRY